MKHIENLTRYTANFVDELVKCGLTDVVISPGSRSTPLALLMKEHKGLKDWMIIDERSAAFFALGMAKEKNSPVALVCTSGTAAVNYYPAIVEAYHSRVPLIVLTTDRPHELRDVGAPQSIDQIHLYGGHVKSFYEMALPESSEEMLKYVRRQASRAFFETNTGNKGPVHFNFPFREPLVPDFNLENIWGLGEEEPFQPVIEGERSLKDEELYVLLKPLRESSRGLIVCGPNQTLQEQEQIIRFAKAWNLPVLADPLSQLRAGDFCKDVIIDGYDAILRTKDIRKVLKPDFILRFGAMPVSKMFLFFIKENSDVSQFIVEENGGYREPSNEKTLFLYTDVKNLCTKLTGLAEKKNDEYLRLWHQMNDVVYDGLFKDYTNPVTEGDAVRVVHEVIPDESILFGANSMAIRDVDTFFTRTDKNIKVLANRGVNGIDGVTSTALGAAANGKRVTLIIGDLSFYHDLNGLLTAKHYDLPITIVLVNNDGGGIFSFLPQAKEARHFEELFGTPIGIDFKPAVEMYGGHYELAKSAVELRTFLKNSYQRKGLSVIEVQTNRGENAKWHEALWQKIQSDLRQLLKESRS